MSGEKESEVLEFLQDKGDYYTKLALIEKKREADLQDAVKHIQTETEKYRMRAREAAIAVMNVHVLTPNPAFKKADGADIARQALNVTTKVLNVMEAKVNKQLQKKSIVLNHIKELKNEIDHYRRMRLQTDMTHAKFESQLSDYKAKIELMLSQATEVVEQREKHVREKENLEKINAEEQRKFTEEYDSMGVFIRAQNDALGESLLKERKEDKANVVVSEESMSTTNKGTMPFEEELDMAKRVGRLTEDMKEEATSLAGIEKKINNYDAMFEELKKMIGATSLDEVVTNYQSHEDEMFSLYNFIQTQNAEIDAVMEYKNQLELEIKSFKEELNEQDRERRKVIEDLHDKLDATQKSTQGCEDENKHYDDGVNQIAKKVSSLFIKLQCEQMDTRGPQSTGGNKNQASKSSGAFRVESKATQLANQGVTVSNVLEYMGCIEQRAVEIIAAYNRLKAEELKEQQAAERRMIAAPPRFVTPGPLSPMRKPTERYPTLDPMYTETMEELIDDVFDPGEKFVHPDEFLAKLKKDMGRKASTTQSPKPRERRLTSQERRNSRSGGIGLLPGGGGAAGSPSYSSKSGAGSAASPNKSLTMNGARKA